MKKKILIPLALVAALALNASFPPQKSAVLGAHTSNAVNCGILGFYATPSFVSYGQSALLSWSTQGCDAVHIRNNVTGGEADLDPDGSIPTIGLTADTAYTISARGPGVTRPVIDLTVPVKDTISSSDCAINSFAATPEQVDRNGISYLAWSTSNCTFVTVKNLMSGRSLRVDPVGSINTVPLTADTAYSLTALSNVNSKIRNLTVKVRNQTAVGRVLGTSTAPCAISTFVATPNSTVKGKGVAINWETSGCDTVTIKNNVSGRSAIASLSGALATARLGQDTTYTITAHKKGSADVTKDLKITVTDGGTACKINSFAATPETVDYEKQATISWDVAKDCDLVIIKNTKTGGSREVDVAGSAMTIPLTAEASYSLTALSGYQGSDTKTIKVGVGAPPVTPPCTIKSFTPDSDEIDYGTNTKISWEVADSCTNVVITNEKTGGSAVVPKASFVYTIGLTEETKYTLSAHAEDGTKDSKTVTIKIKNAPDNTACSIVSFASDSAEVVSGNVATLSWEVTDACNIVEIKNDSSGVSAKVDNKGSISTIELTADASYTLTAVSNNGSQANKTVIIKVSHP